ncbi:AAA family ATPase [Enterobacter asburiae]|uniref:AAA family ATPase n=1 Tax=Enterobacter TaxID=547 RepID=UPI00073851E5|nr:MULTISPECIES: AAA family ATPase [Enterobacter]MBS6013910.1 ATP-binding protein [Enterobacter cloacae]MDP9551553.1 energy-coupling factor transporter ATP-binding protein EcfA2 [Enterobacter mori]AUM04329.2 ATP-binding protein [Enterobacter sp. Crenshaw]ELQ7877183.1 ATP-binding protein [Enterobacter asburiae]ELR9544543.1 ATP-binding protein [Enterobacter asburiae]
MSALSLCIECWRNITDQTYDFSLQYRYRFNQEKSVIEVSPRDDAVPVNFFGVNAEVVCLTGINGSGKTAVMGILNLTGMKLERGQRVDTGEQAMRQAFTYIFKHSACLYVIQVKQGVIINLWKARCNDVVGSMALHCESISSTPIANTWYYASNNVQLSVAFSKISRHDLSIAQRRRYNSYAAPYEIYHAYQAMDYFELRESIAPRFYTWRVQASWYQHFQGVDVKIKQVNQRFSKNVYLASLVVLKLFWLMVSYAEENTGFWKEANVSLQLLDIIPERMELLEDIVQLNSNAKILELLEKFEPLCQSLFLIDTYALVKFLSYIQKGRSSQKGTVRYEFGPSENYEKPFNHVLPVLLKIMMLMREKVPECRFTIDPPFSTGEWKLVDLYATLQRKAEDARLKSKNIQLLLDEPDSDLHPKRQARLIKTVLDILSAYPDVYFQLIISSHNPIVISDLPRASVIPVAPGPEELGKTFGSNIHDLYKHRFFVEQSVGEFASKKIRDALKNPDIDETTLRFLISEVGEPVVTYALQRKLDKPALLERREIEHFISQLTDEQRAMVRGKLSEK